MKNELFEPELKRHLGPVKAPEELWDRLHGAPAVKLQPARGMTWQWAAAAVATVAFVAGTTVWLNRDISSEERAVRALSRTPDQLEFRSSDLAELRAWMKTNAGLDLPLPGHASPNVRVLGASLTRTGIRTATISYRVGDVDASLVVSKASPEGDGRHTIVKTGSYHGADFLSWTMRGQLYTIAAADARVGCILCHSSGAPSTREN